MLTIIRSSVLANALPTILLHQRKVRKHSSSDGCLVLKQFIIFSQADLVPEMGDFAWKFECLFGRKDTVSVIRNMYMPPEALPMIPIHLRKVRKHSSSNGCLVLWHIVTFLRLIWCPNLAILLEILSVYLVEKTLCRPSEDHVCCQRPFRSFLGI